MSHLGDEVEFAKSDATSGDFAEAYRHEGNIMGVIILGLEARIGEYRALADQYVGDDR